MDNDTGLFWICKSTGEVLNRDGSVAGKVVPLIHGQEIRDVMHQCETEPFQTVASAWSMLLAASRVDLSGCEVKVHDTPGQVVNGTPETTAFLRGWKEGIKAVIDQMPKVKK